MENQEIIAVVTEALEDIKATDIVVIDVHDKTSITDIMVIASGSSTRQVKAIAENVIEKVKEKNLRPLGSEGMDGSDWVLVDLGAVLVHVMLPESRQFYDLERLWQGAEQGREQQEQE